MAGKQKIYYLVASYDDLSEDTLLKICNLICHCVQQYRQKTYVYLDIKLMEEMAQHPVVSFDRVQQFIGRVYFNCCKWIYQNFGLNEQICLLLPNIHCSMEQYLQRLQQRFQVQSVLTNGQECVPSQLLDFDVIQVQAQCELIPNITLNDMNGPIQTSDYKDLRIRHVALGGTFDHLHAGHHILLSMACWLSDEQVTVGISDESMVSNKKYKQVLQSLGQRIQSVKDYLDIITSPHLSVRVLPIHDPYGPTVNAPSIDALVVSTETLAGGVKVNEKRAEAGYGPLTIFAVSRQNKEHEDWFQRDHPEHEREFQPEPVNLLRSDSDNEDNENEVSENQYLSQFAASFAEELTLNDKDADHAVDGKIAEADTTLKSSSSQRTTATLTASITRPGLQEKTKPLAIPKLSMKTKSVCPLDDQRERAQISNSITLRNRNHGHIAKTANKENKKMLSCKMPQKAPTEQQIMQLIEKHNKQARKARVQCYAKKQKNAAKIQDATTAGPSYDQSVYDIKVTNAISKLRDDLMRIRVGRANPNIIDKIKVPVDGRLQNLVSIAQIAVKDPQTLNVIAPTKQYSIAIDKAIREANLNLNPQVLSDTVVKVPIPKMSGEQRKTLIKSLNQTAEQYRNILRSIRQDARKAMKRDASLTTNDLKRLENAFQKVIDSNNQTIDKLIEAKSKELQQ
ncbi:hypothetical protein MIR68_006705 [Amoeboaphelidium protococcarum]|nr:hypothetical protein MIR68_006705 [Amoeboaphelidium protococcarum]